MRTPCKKKNLFHINNMYTYLEGQLIKSEVVHQIRAPMLRLVVSSPCAHCLTFDSFSINFIYEAVQYFFLNRSKCIYSEKQKIVFPSIYNQNWKWRLESISLFYPWTQLPPDVHDYSCQHSHLGLDTKHKNRYNENSWELWEFIWPFLEI